MHSTSQKQHAVLSERTLPKLRCVVNPNSSIPRRLAKKDVPLCRKSWLKSWLNSTWNKHGNWFHYADFRDWNRDLIFFWTSSVRSEKFWLKSTKISHRRNTNTAISMQPDPLCRKSAQLPKPTFIREVDGAYVLCMTQQPVHPHCWDVHNKRSMCSSCIHLFVIVIYVHYFWLLSKTFDLWRQFYVIVNNATRDVVNINLQSRFYARCTPP